MIGLDELAEQASSVGGNMLCDVTSTPRVIPVRARAGDDPAEILQFAVEAMRCGGAALATLVEIRGGAARALGAHVAVAADGRYCGYVSGGCVETAVAAEALEAIAEGVDRIVKFGEGSPFFDIALPCGGGITVAIHVLRTVDPIAGILAAISKRQSAGLVLDTDAQQLTLSDRIPARCGWRGGEFLTVYRPQTRLVVSGQTGEVEVVCRLAEAAGYQVVCGDQGAPLNIDPFTAVVLLHHDLDRETHVLDKALSSPAFYIGALGSTRTHRLRVERLRSNGVPAESFNRIKAPIGIFGPTRDAVSLAISIVADVAAARLEAFA
jgi:xanthine dehydrogenase accessory factor